MHSSDVTTQEQGWHARLDKVAQAFSLQSGCTPTLGEGSARIRAEVLKLAAKIILATIFLDCSQLWLKS